jgi:aminoglycoside 3-N-acetyltransferase
MDNYINYTKIPYLWNLPKGSIVYVASDITDLAMSCRHHSEKFSPNSFIDAILDAIGPEGTLLFPTFNWDFCKGITFDYHKTPGKTGSLGQYALKRNDFKRTQHPIYSFAVAGKYKDYLCSLNNESSWGENSPFEWMEKNNAYNVIIGMSYKGSFTFVHYYEQKYKIPCRFKKNFKGDYIDENGEVTHRKYSMYVRYLKLCVEDDSTDMGLLLEEKGVSRLFYINSIPYRVVDIAKCDSLFEQEIKENNGRRFCKYKGQ